MSLDEFHAKPVPLPGPKCSLGGGVQGQIGVMEAGKLEEALAAPWDGPGAVAHVQVSQWLQDKHGIYLSVSSVGRHRRAIHRAPGNRCSCGR